MDIRLGALCWNQYTTWAAMLEAGVRADKFDFATLWTWNHRQRTRYWQGPMVVA